MLQHKSVPIAHGLKSYISAQRAVYMPAKHRYGIPSDHRFPAFDSQSQVSMAVLYVNAI